MRFSGLISKQGKKSFIIYDDASYTGYGRRFVIDATAEKNPDRKNWRRDNLILNQTIQLNPRKNAQISCVFKMLRAHAHLISELLDSWLSYPYAASAKSLLESKMRSSLTALVGSDRVYR
ncbi:MAG: hypothetical protein Q7J84_01270 [Sulfuricaulis sp.]|nr:hypothetical protein [Sulfuricaulis sp.]